MQQIFFKYIESSVVMAPHLFDFSRRDANEAPSHFRLQIFHNLIVNSCKEKHKENNICCQFKIGYKQRRSPVFRT